jgi:CRISPR-associated protein Cas6
VIVDLLFPVRGIWVPTDHHYGLYAALSRLVPLFHEPDADIRFAPLSGLPGEPGRLQLTERSGLRVRLSSDDIPRVLPLAGKSIEVVGSRLRLGPPTVYPLQAAPNLEARLVTFKIGTSKHLVSPDDFLATAKAKLAAMEVAGEPAVRMFESGPRMGQPRRRVVRLKGRAIVGYALLVSGLSADESIRLQERGLGGRTRMGCGFFLPAREGK